jgi:hypothetical protein
MKTRSIILLLLLSSFAGTAQILSTSKGKLRLVGEAQQETIIAESNALEGKFDLATRRFNFRQSLNYFSFSQGELQKKDAQEKYWETDKYPYALFKGMIINDIDFSKNGSYEVTAKGILSMHGVDREVKMPVTIKVIEGTVAVQTTFKVYLSDHNIKIPRLVVLKVSEVFEATATFLLKKTPLVPEI